MARLTANEYGARCDANTEYVQHTASLILRCPTVDNYMYL